MDKYVKRYADFIKKYKIKYYFEMDVDDMGMDNVERWRDYLEKTTGVKCIPVWHFNRGFDYWRKMIKEYDYVAIGGLTTVKQNDKCVELCKKMVKEAHQNNCKVHGLGFTKLSKLKDVDFDTVDSTSWLAFAKYGSLSDFKNGLLEKIDKKTKSTVTSRDLFEYGLKVWKKAAEYYD